MEKGAEVEKTKCWGETQRISRRATTWPGGEDAKEDGSPNATLGKGIS